MFYYHLRVYVYSLFHVYVFSFPYGFNYPALLTTVLFLGHAMVSVVVYMYVFCV